MSDEPKRLTTADFPPEVLGLFDRYIHGALDRRGFLEQAAIYAGSAMAATGMLTALSPDYARAQKIKPEDDRITTSRVDVTSSQGVGTIKVYVAKPKGASPRARKGVVIVIHENRGLNPHIEDIARRLAVEGFIAVAPDALTELGGYPGDETKATQLFGQLNQMGKIRPLFMAVAAWAAKLPDGNGKLGAVGFCYGGGIVNWMATRLPNLRAAVPFYGAPPSDAGIPAIKAELLVFHGKDDTRLAGTWPAYDAALTRAGVKHEGHIYAGAGHGFNNDTTPRYNEAAATDAWAKTIALFKRTLA